MSRKRAAPLTHALLARKGEAVSAPWEQRPAAPASRNIKLWIFVAISLVSATGAMAYLSMPAPETARVASIQSDDAVLSAKSPPETRIPPIAFSPARKLRADVKVYSGPREPMSREELLASAKATGPLPKPEPPKSKAIAVSAPTLAIRAKQDAATALKPAPAAKLEVASAPPVLPRVKSSPPVAAVAKPVTPPPAPKIIAASIPKPRAAKPAPPKRRYTVQLASLKSRAAADREWSRLKRRFAKSLGNLTPSVKKASLAKRGVFYRLRAGEIASRKQARKLCATVKAAGQSCLVVNR